MKVEVGYITRWRRAIFFALIAAVVIFGTVSTLCSGLIGSGLISNVISVGALVLCIGMFILVLSDRWNRYTGFGTASIEDGILTYHDDKKHHFDICLKDITKLDIEEITTGREGGKPIAFRILIQTGKKKYYIESDRAGGRAYQDVDIYRLYLYIQENS
ncbi:MAG: hypothetical protein ACI39Q_02560 [Wujia sp.]